MSRREFSMKVKGQAAIRANGHCENCGVRLPIGGFHFDHDVPDGLGGEPTLENCKVLCLPCHKDKTRLHDNPVMQKADRQRKSVGMGMKTRKGRPFPGSKASGLKKCFDGTVVRRAK